MSELTNVPAAGLGAATAFGAGAFGGGIDTKRDPVVRVVALSHLLSLALLGITLLSRVPAEGNGMQTRSARRYVPVGRQ